MQPKDPHLDEFSSLTSMFFTRAAQGKDEPFLWHKRDKEWQSCSWQEAAEQVAALAYNLRAMGLEDGDRVALISDNRPEWLIADVAIMVAGGVTVPTYITNTEQDHQHILDNSGARIVITTGKLSKTVVSAALRTNVQQIILIEPLAISQQSQFTIQTWDEMVSGGKAHLGEAKSRSAKISSDQLACLIYTSGTGGTPRGVKQHHGMILHNIIGAAVIAQEDFIPNEEVFLSFLPLSHAYEHTAGQYFPILLGAQIYYAEGMEKLSSNIEDVRPTIMIVVPRLFEVIQIRMLKNIAQQGKVANFMLRQALRIGKKKARRKRLILDTPLNLALDKTLRAKIRKKFGGRLKTMLSGGAPLDADIGIFFQSLGLSILQGYGQTEAGPVISCNRPSARVRMDSVGPPLKGTRVRIAEDGEICVSGEQVMQGYWRNKQQSDLVLQDGWLHTGDIGHFDTDGHIIITDRKKDMIINDKGENVSPQRVEGRITLQAEIMQAMVFGDKRPHLVGLIVPDTEWMETWARENNAPNELEKLKDNPEFHRALGAVITRINKQLSITDRIRNFIIADAAFTIGNEQMTPSMKIRRPILTEIYRERLVALYGKR